MAVLSRSIWCYSAPYANANACRTSGGATRNGAWVVARGYGRVGRLFMGRQETGEMRHCSTKVVLGCKPAGSHVLKQTKAALSHFRG